jgi:hypothetical protein
MGAALIEQAKAPLAIAKQHQILAQETDSYWRPVSLGDLMRKSRGNPIAAHELPHGCTRPNAREPFVVFARKHGAASFKDMAFLSNPSSIIPQPLRKDQYQLLFIAGWIWQQKTAQHAVHDGRLDLTADMASKCFLAPIKCNFL